MKIHLSFVIARKSTNEPEAIGGIGIASGNDK
jgi:hypothetical protein